MYHSRSSSRISDHVALRISPGPAGNHSRELQSEFGCKMNLFTGSHSCPK
jgi:hypothetical protein